MNEEKKIIDKLTSIRKEAGITQTELSKAIGISDTHICRVETGKCSPSLNTLVKILNYYNKELSFLQINEWQRIEKEALIVVDMSNDFVAEDGGLTVGEPARAIVPYIANLMREFLDEGKIVFVSMDNHKKDDKHFDLWPVHNVENTYGQKPYGEINDVISEYKDKENCVMLHNKTTYNAMHNGKIHDFFQGNSWKNEFFPDREVTKVHVVGVTTDICVFNTVAGLDAYGYETVVHRHGVATFTDLEDIMLEHMTRCFHTKVIG